MDNGLLSPESHSSYADVFEQQCPHYLSIGMTVEQYWDGDCVLVKYYREADKKRFERKNYEAWVQGRYFYDALTRVSPILNAFAKKGTKAEPYLTEPYPIGDKQEETAETKEKRTAENGKNYMANFAAKFNENFKAKRGER